MEEKRIISIVDLYNLMSNQKILLTYLGDITPDITNALLKSLKSENDKGTDQEVAVKKRVYKIIVECLENICRHTEVNQKGVKPSVFLLGKHDNAYHIVSGNYVTQTQAQEIRPIIEQLTGMDNEEIRKKYREVLAEGKLTARGGAGLGMIDIIQKSGNKLEFDFMPANNDLLFFILKAQVAIA